MSKAIGIVALALLAIFVCVPTGRAQSVDSSTNVQPGQDPSVAGPAVRDTRPLTGVQKQTIEDYSSGRRLLQTSMSLTTQLDKNPSSSGYDNVASASYLLGRLNLHHLSGRSQLSVDYVGGAAISTSGPNTLSNIQDLGFSESLNWRRWSVVLADQVSYLTESPFGFGGVGGLGFLGNIAQSGPDATFGAASSSLQPVLTPSQTILTVGAPRVSNTAVAQAEYHFSRNSSWTVAGSYGLLTFLRAGYTDSRDALFQTGYNYQVNPRSTIGVLYRFDSFRFAGLAQGIDDQVLQVAYSRRIARRMSFQVAAGPDLQVFRAPLSGSSSRLSWNLQSRLSYQVRGTALEASYDHFVASGSGVLVGAQADQVQGAVGRNLTRMWQGSISLGYARSRSLLQIAPNVGERTFDNWYGSVRFNHRLSTWSDLLLAYGARLQGTNDAACAGQSACGAQFITHSLSLGFSWGRRPIALP